MLKDIKEVRVLGGYRLFLRFDDGISGELDLATFIKFDGVFEPLKDLDYFQRVGVDADSGTICWPNGADIDPDVLYSQITGKAIPEVKRKATAAS